MEGWIRLHRKITENEMYLSEPFTRSQAWIDLLLIANYKDGSIRVRGIKVEVKRGQVGWSVEKLAYKWRWSRGKVGRFLLELETEQQIEQQKNHVTNLISIVNYEKYQSDDATDGATNGHQTGQQIGQQTDTNKKDKKEKKVNKEKNNINGTIENLFSTQEVNKVITTTHENSKSQLPLPFASAEFVDNWNILVAQKKWRNKETSALEKSLKKLSKHTEPEAIEMLEACIAGEWQGLVNYEELNKNGNTKKLNGKNQPASSGVNVGSGRSEFGKF